jgi:uncharacterized protein YijF (DUF1287 family)
VEDSKKRREVPNYPLAEKGDLVTWCLPEYIEWRIEKIGIVLSSPDSDGVIQVLWNTGATHLIYANEVRPA